MKRILARVASPLLYRHRCGHRLRGMPRQQTFDSPTASDLGLDPSHAGAWNRLREESLQLRASARQDVRERLQQADTLLAGTSPDLRTFSADIDRQVDDYLVRSRDLRSRMLAFYES